MRRSSCWKGTDHGNWRQKRRKTRTRAKPQVALVLLPPKTPVPLTAGPKAVQTPPPPPPMERRSLGMPGVARRIASHSQTTTRNSHQAIHLLSLLHQLLRCPLNRLHLQHSPKKLSA